MEKFKLPSNFPHHQTGKNSYSVKKRRWKVKTNINTQQVRSAPELRGNKKSRTRAVKWVLFRLDEQNPSKVRVFGQKTGRSNFTELARLQTLRRRERERERDVEINSSKIQSGSTELWCNQKPQQQQQGISFSISYLHMGFLSI
jgi:hypothetical protein